jgi:hypothetical protein
MVTAIFIASAVNVRSACASIQQLVCWDFSDRIIAGCGIIAALVATMCSHVAITQCSRSTACVPISHNSQTSLCERLFSYRLCALARVVATAEQAAG